MAKNKKEKDSNEEVLDQEKSSGDTKNTESTEKKSAKEKDNKEVSVEEELAEMKDKYLRLYSEFDNYRRRTAKERLELLSTATEELMQELIPVIDDFERGMENMENAKDVNAVQEGVKLIFHKFKSVLEAKGLKQMESQVGKELDSDIHEAITQAPAPNEKLKGKIMDEIEKGYYLNDKIIRYSKVVIGS